MDIKLAQYLLPEGVMDYFEIVDHKSSEGNVHFYLEEKNVLPKEYQSELAQSKG
ncbi:transposase, partial [Bizionia saleffrena]